VGGAFKLGVRELDLMTPGVFIYLLRWNFVNNLFDLIAWVMRENDRMEKWGL